MDLGQYKDDVSYQQDLYNQSYGLYVEKKQIHSQYNSIATEKELINIIKNTLAYREDLLSAYLLLLRSSMEEYKPISIDITNSLQQQLFEHQVWLKNQSKQISLIQNKNQLDDYNQSFSQQYIQIQISIDQARVQKYINHQQTLIKRVKNLILSLKAEQSLDQQAQTWINQIEADLQTCQQHLDLANQETQTKQSGRVFKEFYKDSLTEINKSKTILNKTIQDLQGLIKKFS
ncbi:MAG: hypothetical protein ABH831_02330 [Candidatus Nealsonbacteria bacterium]